MRVLYLVSACVPTSGGLAALGICKELRRQGIEAEILTTDAYVEDCSTIVPYGPTDVDGVPVHYTHSPFFHKYALSWDLTWWLRKNLRSYDLVHIDAFFSYAILPTVYYAGKIKMPYILRPAGALNQFSLRRNPLRKKLHLYFLSRRLVEGAAAMHFTSQREKGEAAYLGNNTRGVVIPLGVDDIYSQLPISGKFREKYPLTGDKKIILFLSRIDPKKGLDLLIPALASLRSRYKDFVFVVAGSGDKSFEHKVKSWVREHGLSDITIFTGFVTGAGKLSVLRDADIFVLSSYDENFGLAVTEAMASRLPVVVSDQVHIHKEINSYEAGIVTRLNHMEIAEGIETLLKDDSLRKEMGENGRRLVREKFSWEKIGARLVGLYKSILPRQ